MHWKIGEILNIVAPILDFLAFWLLLISETRERKTRKVMNVMERRLQQMIGIDPKLETRKQRFATKLMFWLSIILITIGTVLWILSGVLEHYDI